jgi:phenylalanyl-tRNA synthetase beta chain
LTGLDHEDSWKNKGNNISLYYAKGIASSVLDLLGLEKIGFKKEENREDLTLGILTGKNSIGTVSPVPRQKLRLFDIKQEVFFVDLNFELLLSLCEKKRIFYEETAKFPSVQRDIAIIVDKAVSYKAVEEVVNEERVSMIKNMRLFDVFENEKLGADKKSLAINFTFSNEEKTLTDKETDAIINRLITGFEKKLGAEIRK